MPDPDESHGQREPVTGTGPSGESDAGTGVQGGTRAAAWARALDTGWARALASVGERVLAASQAGLGGVRAWWWRRSVAFRRAWRTSVLLLVTGLASLLLGLTTAQATSPVGPHTAVWETTLSSQVALDLGPLGTAWTPSPVAPLGVRVTIGEIPGAEDLTSATGSPAAGTGEAGSQEGQATGGQLGSSSSSGEASGQGASDGTDGGDRAGTSAQAGAGGIGLSVPRELTDQLGSLLSADGAAYLSLVSHPELTVRAGARALLGDALRRAGLAWSVTLCLVAACRLASGGHLREVAGRVMSRPLTAGLGAVTAGASALALLVPAVTTTAAGGATVQALAGTPLASAHFSGRLGDVVSVYGPALRTAVDDSDDFYRRLGVNLNQAWALSEDLGGLVDVRVGDDGITAWQRRELSFQAAVRRLDATARMRQARADAAGAGGEGASSTGGVEASDPASPDPEATAPETSAPEASASQTSVPETASPTASAPGPDAARVPLGALTGPLAALEPGTRIAVLTTDLHCNLDVIELAGRLDTLAGASIHLDAGDLTMTGSEPEQVCVDALSAAVPDGVARAATIGNHDSAATATQLRGRGWTVMDGTVQQVGGLRLLGDVDPDRTVPGSNGPRGDESAADVGRRLAQVSCASPQPPDLMLIHQPYTFWPIAEEGCVPLLLAGHTHQEQGMTTVAGRTGPVTELRSGAALGGISIGPLRADAYLHVLALDRESHLVGWRAVVLHPDASVSVGAWQEVPLEGQTLGQVSSQSQPQAQDQGQDQEQTQAQDQEGSGTG